MKAGTTPVNKVDEKAEVKEKESECQFAKDGRRLLSSQLTLLTNDLHESGLDQFHLFIDLSMRLTTEMN